MRRVVCAALRAADGELVLGIRHYSNDMWRQIERRLDRDNFLHLHDDNQGFVDQHGVFMSRAEAFEVAYAAEQIINATACRTVTRDGLLVPKLYSEGLY